jgi:hypothetical protein
MVEDAMLFSIGKPDPRLVASSKDGHARRLDGCGEVHGAAVMPNKDSSMRQDGGALARCQEATEVDDRTLRVFSPAIRRKLTGVTFFCGPA